MPTTLNQKPQITREDASLLSMKQSHASSGTQNYCCSDFIASLNLLAEGEYKNKEPSKSAKVVLTDLKTGQFKGGSSFIQKSLLSLSHASSKAKGTAITSNKTEVHSVGFFSFKDKIFLGVSGDGPHFEVFDVSQVGKAPSLSTYSFF